MLAEGEEEEEPSDVPCPDCGGPTHRGPWWDDPPELGGACIGFYLKCRACGWLETY